MPTLIRLLFALPLAAALPSAALAGSFQFLAAPGIDVNLLYRLDQLTGEVTVCQYGSGTGDAAKTPFGVTFCHPAGAGATKQEPGRYELMASRHEKEAGVFRVELLTGTVSNCFLHIGKEGEKVVEDFVVCTPPAK
jgi:hypothetical protein